MGRAAEAIPLFERTLAGCERVLGPDHPDTLASRDNLAAAGGPPADACPHKDQGNAAHSPQAPDVSQVIRIRRLGPS